MQSLGSSKLIMQFETAMNGTRHPSRSLSTE